MNRLLSPILIPLVALCLALAMAAPAAAHTGSVLTVPVADEGTDVADLIGSTCAEVSPESNDSSLSSRSVDIEPYIIEPEDGANVYGDIEIWATELIDPTGIVSALFEYSPNGSDWYDIGIDYDGTIEAKAVDCTTYQSDIWTQDWAINTLAEGWYYLRVTMASDTSVGQDEVLVYVDPTPPIPVLSEPTLIDGLVAPVTEVVAFEAATTDEDVVCMTLEYLRPTPAIHVDYWWWPWYWEKGIPKKDQHDYGPLKGNPKNSQKWKDDTSCGPTSAGSSLWYWAKKYPKVYGNLTKEAGKQLTQTELIDKLHDYTKTVERSPKTGGEGVSDPNMLKGIREWIKKHGDGLTVKYVKKKDFTFKKYVTELLKCEDLLVSTDRHWMVGNSVSFPKNADGTYDVDFMDPWTGNYTTVKMKKNGDFTKYGRPKDTMIVISPTAEKEKEVLSWVPIDLDTFGGDGWSVLWDTTGINMNEYYILRISMTDANERSGSDMILVYLGARSIGGTTLPTDKLGLMMPWIMAAGALIVLGGVSLAIWSKKRGRERGSSR